MMQVNIWFTNSRSRDSFVQIHCIWTRMSLSFELDLWRQRSIYNVITIFAFVYIKLKQDSTKISFNTLTWFDIQFHNDLINFLKRAIELDIMELNYSAFIAAFLYALSSRSSDSQCCGHLNSPQRQATHVSVYIMIRARWMCTCVHTLWLHMIVFCSFVCWHLSFAWLCKCRACKTIACFAFSTFFVLQCTEHIRWSFE